MNSANFQMYSICCLGTTRGQCRQRMLFYMRWIFWLFAVVHWPSSKTTVKISAISSGTKGILCFTHTCCRMAHTARTWLGASLHPSLPSGWTGTASPSWPSVHLHTVSWHWAASCDALVSYGRLPARLACWSWCFLDSKTWQGEIKRTWEEIQTDEKWGEENKWRRQKWSRCTQEKNIKRQIDRKTEQQRTINLNTSRTRKYFQTHLAWKIYIFRLWVSHFIRPCNSDGGSSCLCHAITAAAQMEAKGVRKTTHRI